MTGTIDRENLWGYRKRLHFVVDVLCEIFPDRFPQRLRVLDVGCGNGSQLALPLAHEGIAIAGIDLDEKSITHANQLASGTRSAHFQKVSIEQLVESDFDAVILSEVLEHVSNPGDLLQASVDRLSKSGIVIVTTPNGYGEFEWDSWLFGLLRGRKLVDALAKKSATPLGATDTDSCGHVQFFTQRRLLELFSAAGLEVWRVRPATLFAGPIAGHSLARSQRFIEWNARVTDSLPLALASGWYFALRRVSAGALS